MSKSNFVSGRQSTSSVSSSDAPLSNQHVLHIIFPRLTTFPLARVYEHTSVLDVEVYPNMPRNWSKAAPEGNGPTPQDVYVMITWEKLRRVLSESMGEAFREFEEDLRRIGQRVASLEQDARQPRLAMEADVKAVKRTRERTEGAATVVQAKHGDSCSAKRVQAGPTSSTRSGVKAEPPALPCRDEILVENGSAAPKSCISPLEMRTTTAVGGLLPAGTTSTATRTTSDQPPLWFCPTEEKKIRTPILYASCYSIFWGINNQQAPFWSRVIEKKTGQNLVFDPGGSTGRLRACPFWGTWRALLCGEVFVRALDEATACFGGWMTRSHQLAGEVQANHLRRAHCGRSLFLRSQAGLKMSCRQRRLEAI